MPTIEETTRTDRNEQRKPRNAYPIMKIKNPELHPGDEKPRLSL